MSISQPTMEPRFPTTAAYIEAHRSAQGDGHSHTLERDLGITAPGGFWPEGMCLTLFTAPQSSEFRVEEQRRGTGQPQGQGPLG